MPDLGSRVAIFGRKGAGIVDNSDRRSDAVRSEPAEEPGDEALCAANPGGTNQYQQTQWCQGSCIDESPPGRLAYQERPAGGRGAGRAHRRDKGLAVCAGSRISPVQVRAAKQRSASTRPHATPMHGHHQVILPAVAVVGPVMFEFWHRVSSACGQRPAGAVDPRRQGSVGGNGALTGATPAHGAAGCERVAATVAARNAIRKKNECSKSVGVSCAAA